MKLFKTMKLHDKIMYFGSSSSAVLALVLYLFLTPPGAKAQCNGCTDPFTGNCDPVGTCRISGCSTCPKTNPQGALCQSNFQWGFCGSCTAPFC